MMFIEKTPLQKIQELKSGLGISVYLISAVVILLLYSVAAYFDIALYMLIGVLALPIMWWMIHYPKVWIYIVVCGFLIFMKMDDEGITFSDIFAAVFYNAFLIIWFISKLVVKSEASLKDNSQNNRFPITALSDKLFLLFYFLLLFNAAIAVFNGVSILDWIREYMLYSLILFYFPLREYFKEVKGIKVLLFLLAIVVIVLDFQQFLKYFKMLKDIKYAFQIGSTIRINQQIFSCSFVTALTLFFFSGTFKGKILAFIISVCSAAAIISTFSRAYWAAIIGMVVLLFIFLNYRQVFQLFLILVVSSGLLLLSINTFFPKQSAYITKYIEKRFSSTTKGTKDVSVISRLREYNVVLREIKESPIWGHGFRKKFSFYNNIGSATKVTSFTHNGYLNLSHKAGIPLAALFYLSIGLIVIKGFIVSWRMNVYRKKSSDNSSKIYAALAISGSLSLLMLLIVNGVTSSIIFRDGLMVTAFSIAFINIAEYKYSNIRTEGSQTPLLPELSQTRL